MTTPVPPRLQDLRGEDLATLHADGVAPDPRELHGVLDGVVLGGALDHPALRPLRLWRGKVVDEHVAGRPVTGRNRIGLGPGEVRRFTFEARAATSLFSEREVVRLDHDRPGNPAAVRRFHDELVRIEPGLFLATSPHRASLDPASPLRFLCHFALATR